MYARPPKESHLDTIYYEIGMLRFCASWLCGRRPDPLTSQEELTAYVFLECFLHCRNLVRFFNGKNHQDGDLSTKHPEVWAEQALSEEEGRELDRSIRQPALRLEPWHDKISKYLQHCTEHRSNKDVSWDLNQMMAELAPILDAFEQSFPNRDLPPRV